MNYRWVEVEQGIQRRIFPPGISIMMMEVKFEKGVSGAKHKHVHEQFTYVLEGSFEFQLNDEIYVVHSGETIFIPSNVIHGVTALTDGRLLDAFTPLRQDLLEA